MRFPWNRREEELRREVGQHLQHLQTEYERQGHSREEAQRLARRDFGGPEQIKEQCRDERRGAWVASIVQDVVFGLRMLRRSPVMTAAVVLTLALGIGANTAVISLMDVVLWRDLPVPHPQLLTLVYWQGHGFPNELADGGSGSMWKQDGNDIADFFSYDSYSRMRDGVAQKAMLAAYQEPNAVSVSVSGHASVAERRYVSGNLFATLQVLPAYGRPLLDSDDTANAPPVALVSHSFWAKQLNADPRAIGKTISVNTRLYIVVGVLPQSFYGLIPGDPTAVYVPLHQSTTERADSWLPVLNDRVWNVSLLARRYGSTTDEQLRPLLNNLFRATWSKQPKNLAVAPSIWLDAGSRGLGFVRRDCRNPMLVLGCLVGLLLVIACANIGSLLLARAVARHREVTVRVALGCSRLRLVRQFLTESALLAVLGGIASLLIGVLTANFLGRFLVARDSQPLAVTIDLRVLILVSAITATALTLFGIFPAVYGSRLSKATWSRSGVGSLGRAISHKLNAGRILVVAQMAMSVVLVMAAVVLTKNLLSIEATDPGFDRRNLVLFGIRPGTSGYEKTRLPSFYFQVQQRLSATSGVAAVGMASMRPMNVGGWWESVRLAGTSTKNQASINGITAGYLPLYFPRLIAGRNLTQGDVDSDAQIAVVSEDLAMKLGGESVLGRVLEFPDGPPGKPPKRFQIVGIAPVIAATSIKERPYAVWLPIEKDAREVTVVLRTSQSPRAVLPAIRNTMREIDPNLPLVDVMTMEEQIAVGLRREKMFATLCSGFGILALVLSAVGLYGIIAFSTSRRKGEMGIRMALGAVPRDVALMVLRDGMTLAAAGLLIGMPVVWIGIKYIHLAVEEVKQLDTTSLTLSTAILIASAFFAVAIPAFRAARLDPADTLREE